MAPARRRPPATNAAELHRQWLELVDIEGPFLAIPPLRRVWPNGMPDFRSNHPDRYDVLADARKDFETAWESLDRNPGSEGELDQYRVARDKWVETVLRDVVGWADSLQWGAVAGVQAESPNRAVTVTAQASLVSDAGIGALVHVVDRGIGIPASEQAKVFQRFYRIDPSRTKTRTPGTGLGLAIVKHLLILHGGTVRLESEPLRGSRFTVTLPAAPAAALREAS